MLNAHSPARRARSHASRALESLERRVLFDAGDLDPSFGGDGVVTSDYAGWDTPMDVAVLSDGKVLVAGGAGTPDDPFSAERQWFVARFNADGSPDAGFGGDGSVLTEFSPGRDGAWAVAAAPGGKVMAVGVSSADLPNQFPSERFTVVRYNADGSLDRSFSGDGIAFVDFAGAGGGQFGRAFELAVYPDGRSVVVGTSERRFAVARLNADGTLDDSFGAGGRTTTQFNVGNAEANHVAFASDGRIVVAGDFLSGSARRAVVARYLPNGQLDTSFSNDGRFFVGSGDDVVFGEGLAVQDDGKIVVMSNRFDLWRIKSGGGLDTRFGTDGVARSPVGVPFTWSTSLSRDARGRLIASGAAPTSAQGSEGAVVRFSADGQVDSSFGSGGVARQAGDIGAARNAVSPDGHILLAGNNAAGRGKDVSVARLLGDDTDPPPTGGDVSVQGEDASGPQDGWVVRSSHAGFTGSGYLDFTADSGASADWNLDDLPGPGDYVIDFRYANGSASPRTLGMEAFPGNTRSVTFAPTGAWSTWQTESVPVTLSGGGNAFSLSLFTQGSNGPNIDSITIRKLGTTPPPTGSTLQAEQATVVGAQVASNTQGYTGTGFVDFLHGTGDSVEWSFNDPGGSRTLSFRYANGSSSDRPLELRLNGRILLPRLSFAPTGSWSTWREVTVTADLAAGANRVKLTSVGNNGADIDLLRVR